MFECQLIEYITPDILKNNLMQDKGSKNSTTMNPHIREDIITQALNDKFGFILIKDSLFKDGRNVQFYNIDYFEITDRDKESEKLNQIDSRKIIKEASCQEFIYTVNGIDYTVMLEQKNSRVYRKKNLKENENNINGKDDIIYLRTAKRKSKSGDIFSDNSTETRKGEVFYQRNFEDSINGLDYFLSISFNKHEIDGYIITKDDIDISANLGDLLFYPLNKEDTKIQKNSKIMIESKQNASLEEIFNQMVKVVNDIKKIVPDESFCYFGFLNEKNATKKIDEKLLIEKIREFEQQNKNYRIFLFIIKDNKFLGLNLEEQANYSVHYLNQMKKEKLVLEEKINTLNDQLNILNEKKQKQIQQFNLLKEEIKNINNRINNLSEGKIEQINKLKDEINDNFNKIIIINNEIRVCNEKINFITSEITGLKNEFNDLKNKINGVEDKINGIEDKMNVVEDKINVVENRINGVENKIDSKFNGVENRINGMENKIENKFSAMENRFIIIMIFSVFAYKIINKISAYLGFS